MALYFTGWGYAFHRNGFKWYDVFTPHKALFRMIELIQLNGWWVVLFILIPPILVAFFLEWLLG